MSKGYVIYKKREDIMLQFLLSISDESDHEKIEHLYNRYHECMLRFSTSKFNSFGRRNSFYDAEDAVQNTFVKITKYIKNIDFSVKSTELRNYIFSILTNEIYNVLNEDIEFDEFDEEYIDDQECDFVKRLAIQEFYDKVVETIESMDEKYSTTLFSFYCKEMTVKEIADVMGISTKTVYTRVMRGKRLLLDSLEVNNYG